MRNLDRINWYLQKKGLSLESIAPAGQTERLHDIPNYSAGGSVSTLTREQLHPGFITLAETISKVVNLTICGIDFVVKDLQQEAINGNVAIIEVNSDPGIRLHDLPNEGKSQQVSEKILQYYFRSE